MDLKNNMPTPPVLKTSTMRLRCDLYLIGDYSVADSFVKVSMHAPDCGSVCAPLLMTGSRHAKSCLNIARPLPPDVLLHSGPTRTAEQESGIQFTPTKPTYVQACIHAKTRSSLFHIAWVIIISSCGAVVYRCAAPSRTRTARANTGHAHSKPSRNGALITRGRG